jgi:hypothetical protein
MEEYQQTKRKGQNTIQGLKDKKEKAKADNFLIKPALAISAGF